MPVNSTMIVHSLEYEKHWMALYKI